MITCVVRWLTYYALIRAISFLLLIDQGQTIKFFNQIQELFVMLTQKFLESQDSENSALQIKGQSDSATDA